MIKEAHYRPEHNDHFLKNLFVFGINSDQVRKDCFKEGSTLTFEKAMSLAKAEESANKTGATNK